MRKSHHFFFICLFIVISSPIFAQGISMSPTRAFFSGNPGETVTQMVILHNGSNKDYVFNINYKDWLRENDGNKIYSESGSLETSNASWISTLENTVIIPAGVRKEILVTMQIPEDASKSDVTNSMLFFTQLPQQSDQVKMQNGIGIISLSELGLHVYYTPPGNNIKSLEITNIEEVVNNANKMVAVSITNDGNVVNDATVEFELTNTDSGEDIKLKSIPISMMPGTHQVVHFTLPVAISGTYLGVTIIKMAGTNDLRVGEKTFNL